MESLNDIVLKPTLTYVKKIINWAGVEDAVLHHPDSLFKFQALAAPAAEAHSESLPGHCSQPQRAATVKAILPAWWLVDKWV